MLKLVLFINHTFQDFSTPQQKSEKTGQFPTRGNLSLVPIWQEI